MTELGSLGGSVHDPEPSVPRLAKLADQVLSGDIVLPKFQRNFVWSRQQILDLLDSVSRNYPIGSVLLWQSTEQLASERSVAGLTVAAQRHGYPVNYIIDGQQRLASICGALHWRSHGDPPPYQQVPTWLLSDPAGFGFARPDIDRLRELSKNDLRLAVQVAAEAAKRAVDFLTTQIRTPRAEELPYFNQFAVLTELFRLVPKPTATQYAAIHRWFWLTAGGEYFKGWNENQMAADRAAVVGFASCTTTEIEAGAGMPRSLLWRRSAFRRINAPSKLLALLLADADSLDLRTGQRIDVGRALSWQNDKEFHHLFPKAFLRARSVRSTHANVCANLIMLSSVTNIWVSDRAPSEYLRDLCETEGEEVIRRRLASCLVDDAAFDAATMDDYDGFLRARSETLHARLVELIDKEVIGDGELAPLPDEAEYEFDPDEPVDRDSADWLPVSQRNGVHDES